ncbi:hypothetical protein B0H13DRAFT_1908594 [Mycena leptocephala]|nr:hypothetical protein B0H13DRAFT_1908594 [Mycena leptocephala]
MAPHALGKLSVTGSDQSAARGWIQIQPQLFSASFFFCPPRRRLVGHLLLLGIVVVVAVERVRVIAATVKTPTPTRTAIGMGEAAAGRDHVAARERAGEGAGDAPKRARRAVPVGVGGQGVRWRGVKSRKLVGEARRYSRLVFDDAERAGDRTRETCLWQWYLHKRDVVNAQAC